MVVKETFPWFSNDLHCVKDKQARKYKIQQNVVLKNLMKQLKTLIFKF